MGKTNKKFKEIGNQTTESSELRSCQEENKKKKINKLANKFIEEMQNAPIKITDNSKGNYDIFAFVDNFSKEAENEFREIYDKLLHTSIGQIFERYLAEVLLSVDNVERKFNETEFNEFAWNCRMNYGFPGRNHNGSFFVPFEEYAVPFFNTVFLAVKDYANKNAAELRNAAYWTLVRSQIDESAPDFIENPRQRLYHWIELANAIRHSGNTKFLGGRLEKAIKGALTSKRECGFTRSNSCSDLKTFG